MHEILAIFFCYEEVPRVRGESQNEEESPYGEAIAILQEAIEGWDAVELRDCLPEIDDLLDGARPDRRYLTLISVALDLRHRKADFYRIYGYPMDALDPPKQPDHAKNQANGKAANGNGRGKKANRR